VQDFFNIKASEAKLVETGVGGSTLGTGTGTGTGTGAPVPEPVPVTTGDTL